MLAAATGGKEKPLALSLLASERPRNVGWKQAGGLLFGDWGTSRLYVLGLAFFFARAESFYLILAMSVLVMAVGWAYSQICRIYPDGGGVYTAAKHKSRTLAVVGALLLFADYVVTASLSALDAFHYLDFKHVLNSEHLISIYSPGLWAMVAIAAIGLFNLMGPKHTGGFAIAAAVGMMAITLLITLGALPQVKFGEVAHRIQSTPLSSPSHLWLNFVAIVLALSGVEAIGNLTGVMNKPVAKTARKAIFVVAIEVAVFNVLLGICMIAKLSDAEYDLHKEDMLAYLSQAYIGVWAEYGVRLVGGLLLLSAVNTVVTDMISVQYLLSRDGEVPMFFQKLNRFGVPWVATIIATIVPVGVLVVSHDLEHLAALYAIGVVGAVAINITLVSTHPRLRGWYRKVAALALGVFLMAIWVTLAATKLHALAFVSIVMAVGLTARALTKWYATRKGPRLSLLRQAIAHQLTPEVAMMPKVLVGTYGSDSAAPAALAEAKATNSALVVCFVREVALSFKYDAERPLSIDTDVAALKTFSRFLDLAHDQGVPVIPVYDTGNDASVLMAEAAAVYGVDRILIGTSRQGALYNFVKGRFQERLESLLPPEIQVKVVSTTASLSHPVPVLPEVEGSVAGVGHG